MLRANEFAAQAYRERPRLGVYGPMTVRVANILTYCGVEDSVVLIATVLYSVMSDTETTAKMIEDEFGSEVLSVLSELTYPSGCELRARRVVRKERAPRLSDRAKLIELAM